MSSIPTDIRTLLEQLTGVAKHFSRFSPPDPTTLEKQRREGEVDPFAGRKKAKRPKEATERFTLASLASPGARRGVPLPLRGSPVELAQVIGKIDRMLKHIPAEEGSFSGVGPFVPDPQIFSRPQREIGVRIGPGVVSNLKQQMGSDSPRPPMMFLDMKEQGGRGPDLFQPKLKMSIAERGMGPTVEEKRILISPSRADARAKRVLRGMVDAGDLEGRAEVVQDYKALKEAAREMGVINPRSVLPLSFVTKVVPALGGMGPDEKVMGIGNALRRLDLEGRGDLDSSKMTGYTEELEKAVGDSGEGAVSGEIGGAKANSSARTGAEYVGPLNFKRIKMGPDLDPAIVALSKEPNDYVGHQSVVRHALAPFRDDQTNMVVAGYQHDQVLNDPELEKLQTGTRKWEAAKRGNRPDATGRGRREKVAGLRVEDQNYATFDIPGQLPLFPQGHPLLKAIRGLDEVQPRPEWGNRWREFGTDEFRAYEKSQIDRFESVMQAMRGAHPEVMGLIPRLMPATSKKWLNRVRWQLYGDGKKTFGLQGAIESWDGPSVYAKKASEALDLAEEAAQRGDYGALANAKRAGFNFLGKPGPGDDRTSRPVTKAQMQWGEHSKLLAEVGLGKPIKRVEKVRVGIPAGGNKVVSKTKYLGVVEPGSPEWNEIHNPRLEDNLVDRDLMTKEEAVHRFGWKAQDLIDANEGENLPGQPSSLISIPHDITRDPEGRAMGMGASNFGHDEDNSGMAEQMREEELDPRTHDNWWRRKQRAERNYAQYGSKGMDRERGAGMRIISMGQEHMLASQDLVRRSVKPPMMMVRMAGAAPVPVPNPTVPTLRARGPAFVDDREYPMGKLVKGQSQPDEWGVSVPQIVRGRGGLPGALRGTPPNVADPGYWGAKEAHGLLSEMEAAMGAPESRVAAGIRASVSGLEKGTPLHAVLRGLGRGGRGLPIIEQIKGIVRALTSE